MTKAVQIKSPKKLVVGIILAFIALSFMADMEILNKIAFVIIAVIFFVSGFLISEGTEDVEIEKIKNLEGKR